MAVCGFCHKEMLDPTVTTCVGNGTGKGAIVINGKEYAPVPYTPDYGGPDHRCHDCNIGRGGLHHPMCDMEICPKCGGQLISCGCLDDGIDVEWKGEEE